MSTVVVFKNKVPQHYFFLLFKVELLSTSAPVEKHGFNWSSIYPDWWWSCDHQNNNMDNKNTMDCYYCTSRRRQSRESNPEPPPLIAWVNHRPTKVCRKRRAKSCYVDRTPFHGRPWLNFRYAFSSFLISSLLFFSHRRC